MSNEVNNWCVADICDDFREEVSVINKGFKSYGKIKKCFGIVETIVLETDNKVLIETLSSNGDGKIAYVYSQKRDGALVGDRVTALAKENNWQGIIVDGCIRDTAVINEIDFPVFANGTYPIRGRQNGGGVVGETIKYDNIIVSPGCHIYADSDGVIIAEKHLL